MTSFLRQPRAVWAVAFACVIAFMGIGLVDPILKPIADQLDATPSQVSLLFTSYMAVMGVAMLVTGVISTRIGAKRTLLARAGADHRLLGAGRAVRLDRGDRRLPRRLGVRQRAVHRHGARDHRVVGPGLDRAGDHPVRGRARPRHRGRPAARRSTGLDHLAGAVPRRRRPDGDRARGDHVPAAVDAAGRAANVAGRPVPGAPLPGAADHRAHRALLQHGLLHAARVHALPAGHDRPSGRADLLRLGPAARRLLGVGGAGPAAPVRVHPDRARQPGPVLPRPRRDGRVDRPQGASWSPAWWWPVRSSASTTP